MISSLIACTSQSKFSHNFFAVTACAPFPRSKHTLNFFAFIESISIKEIIPSMYVEITFVSSNDLPKVLALIQFFSSKICSIFRSSSREISTPSDATGLIPLYCGGLCDAVIINPPS